MDFLPVSSINWSSVGMVAVKVILTIIAFCGVFISLTGLPGIVLVYACMVVYAVITGFDDMKIASLIVAGIITIVFFLVDNITLALGVKAVHASKKAATAAFLGSILGLIAFGPIGGFLGPLVLVIIVEYYTDPDAKKALKAGVGTFIGFLAGILVRFMLSLILFVWLVIEMVK